MAKKTAAQNKEGRPMRFKTPADLQMAVHGYFKEISESPITSRIVPTISGLAIALDVDRKTLSDYEEREDEYSTLIKRAMMMIENFWESKLAGQTCTGAIFWLKNRGWKDEQKVDHTSKGESIKEVRYVAPLTAPSVVINPPDGDTAITSHAQAAPGVPGTPTA